MRYFLPVTALAALVASSAQGDFVGGGVVSLQSWNDAANATALPTVAGGPVRVYRLYMAFDSQDITDRVNYAFAADISVAGSIVNVTNSFPTGEAFENPAVQWDSFVTINVETLQDGLMAAGDPEFAWGLNSLQGGWFVNGSDQGRPGTNAGSDDFGTGYFLVMVAQFTVLSGGAPSGDLLDFLDDGRIGGGGLLSGSLRLGVQSQVQSSIGPFEIVIPAPGGAFVVFGGLFAAARRRRSAA